MKLDVERGELAALRGAARALALSVYHRPADMWELPAYARSMMPTHLLYLRTHAQEGIDTILYAAPVA